MFSAYAFIKYNKYSSSHYNKHYYCFGHTARYVLFINNFHVIYIDNKNKVNLLCPKVSKASGTVKVS